MEVSFEVHKMIKCTTYSTVFYLFIYFSGRGVDEVCIKHDISSMMKAEQLP